MLAEAAALLRERGRLQGMETVQRRKDDLCRVPVDCEPERQEKTIAKYKEAKERVEEIAGFYTHACIWAATSFFIFLINYMTNRHDWWWSGCRTDCYDAGTG